MLGAVCEGPGSEARGCGVGVDLELVMFCRESLQCEVRAREENESGPWGTEANV